MQSPSVSRKRPAPGTSPLIPQQMTSQTGGIYTESPDMSGLSDQQFLNWGQAAAPAFNDPTAPYADPLYNPDPYKAPVNGLPQATGLQYGPDPGQQLIRRPTTNQQLAPRQKPFEELWQENNNAGNITTAEMDPSNLTDEELRQRAAIAQREAQGKRKQIPPFVQKLSSFLDQNNTDLIRWSDDGNSFIVIDEDEFARTLIPELFKHNNYASFVRQLNMYGFHKKVGLSDNSMKASERKAKTPSEYWNPYFKRGRPELLWLIQKPKATPSMAKRKRDDDKRQQTPVSDDDRKYSPDAIDKHPVARAASQDLVTMPRSELTSIQQELQQVQRSQRIISAAIGRLREQNQQFYQQASAFQALHDRHESSINAILTFLATFYNRSLQDQGAGPNIAGMFNAQPSGNVVDVGDYEENAPSNSAGNMPQRTSRRPLALLPAPGIANGAKAMNNSGRASTLSASTWSNLSPQAQRQAIFRQASAEPGGVESIATTPASQPRKSISPPIKGDAETPNLLGAVPETDDIMSVINNVNASNRGENTNGPRMDFSSALEQYQNANGNSPLTAQQRNDVLSLIAGHHSAATTPGVHTDNALTAPNPPPMPNLDHVHEVQQQLDMLQKLQEQQDAKVQNLTNRLQPLSPNGSLPGIDSYPNNPAGDPGQFDLDDFTSGQDYFPTDTGTTNNNLDFNSTFDADQMFDFGNGDFDFGGGQDGGRIVESVSSSATSPAATGDVDQVDESEDSGRKRRRVQ